MWPLWLSRLCRKPQSIWCCHSWLRSRCRRCRGRRWSWNSRTSISWGRRFMWRRSSWSLSLPRVLRRHPTWRRQKCRWWWCGFPRTLFLRRTSWSAKLSCPPHQSGWWTYFMSGLSWPALMSELTGRISSRWGTTGSQLSKLCLRQHALPSTWQIQPRCWWTKLSARESEFWLGYWTPRDQTRRWVSFSTETSE